MMMIYQPGKEYLVGEQFVVDTRRTDPLSTMMDDAGEFWIKMQDIAKGGLIRKASHSMTGGSSREAAHSANSVSPEEAPILSAVSGRSTPATDKKEPAEGRPLLEGGTPLTGSIRVLEPHPASTADNKA